MVVKPYHQQQLNNNTVQRIFEHHTDASELVWHRDRRSRTVKVTEGKGWRFQMDNGLPQTLEPGDVLHIPANTYHRIIKGSDNLVVEITEHETDNTK